MDVLQYAPVLFAEMISLFSEYDRFTSSDLLNFRKAILNYLILSLQFFNITALRQGRYKYNVSS